MVLAAIISVLCAMTLTDWGSWAAIIAVVIVIAGSIVKLVMYLSNKRIASYIVEGQYLQISYSDSTLSDMAYIVLERDWSKNVFKDIQRHKGQVENFVVLEAKIQVFEGEITKSDSTQVSRDYAHQIVATRLQQLKGLRKRL